MIVEHIIDQILLKRCQMLVFEGRQKIGYFSRLQSLEVLWTHVIDAIYTYEQ